MDLLQDIPMEKQEQILDEIAKKVVRMGMVTPAIMFLEMNKPVNFLGSQVMLFMEPLAGPLSRVLLSYPHYHALTVMLEKRSNIEKLLQKIEFFDKEYRKQVKENKKSKLENKNV